MRAAVGASEFARHWQDRPPAPAAQFGPEADVLVVCRSYPPLAQAYAAGDVPGAVRGFYDSIYQPDWQARMEHARPGAFGQSVRDAAIAFESDMPGTDWNDGLQADEVAAVRCPVLSVLGTGTLPLFADGRKLLHDWFPWCQDADIDGGDHMLPIEYPDATASAIAAFLAHPNRR